MLPPSGKNTKTSTGRLLISSVISGMMLLLILVFPQSKACAEKNPPLVKLSSLVRHPQGTFVNVNAPTPGANLVSIGLYGINIYNLDLKSSTYSMTAYMWLRWKGDYDPVETLDFINLVQNVNFTKKTLLATPTVLSNGEKYQVIRLDGSFYQPFNVTRYPLDKQQLSLYIENSTDTSDKIFYVPDLASTSYDIALIVPGWETKGLEIKSYLHDYGTDFGETGVPLGSKYSRIKFSVNLDRYTNFFVWKLLIPLLIILMTNWLTLLLHPSFFEVRAAMPATALLTIVFLQQSSLDAIPGCASLVLMDKIYLLAIFNVALTLLQIIIVNNKLDKESCSNLLKMIRVDKISFIVQILFFAVCLAILLLLA